MDSTAKQKDLSFLTALRDLGWEATSEEIRIRTESDPEIVDLNNGHISHRRNKRFQGDQNSKPLSDCLVVEDSGPRTNGESPPKVVRVKDDQREDVEQFVKDNLADGTVGMFGSPEEAFEDLMTTIDEQKASIDELEAKNESLEAKLGQMQAEFTNALRPIRDVFQQEFDVDLKEASSIEQYDGGGR